MANVYQALDNNLTILPVINKIDLPSADGDRVIEEVENIIGLDCSGAVKVSAKQGTGIDTLLEAIVESLPSPAEGSLLVDRPLRATVFDTYYDQYRGVVVFFRIVEGMLSKGDKVRFLRSPQVFSTALGSLCRE